MSTRPTASEGESPFHWFRADHARVLERIADLDARMEFGGPLDEVSLHAIVAHLQHQFATHMAAEDAQLFPVLDAALPESRGALAPLRAEHGELRDMLAALTGQLREPRTVRRDEQIRVVARDFTDLLRLHLRKEESFVFDVALRVLSRAELDALAQRVRPMLEPQPAPEDSARSKGSSD